jgi:RNA polymerase sigma factor (sigma-70 family)
MQDAVFARHSSGAPANLFLNSPTSYLPAAITRRNGTVSAASAASLKTSFAPGSAVDTVADPRSPAEQTLAEDREAVRRAANETLSPRQQRILKLSLEGWSVHEIGEELTLPVERVSDEKYKAVRKLRARLEKHEG